MLGDGFPGTARGRVVVVDLDDTRERGRVSLMTLVAEASGCSDNDSSGSDHDTAVTDGSTVEEDVDDTLAPDPESRSLYELILQIPRLAHIVRAIHSSEAKGGSGGEYCSCSFDRDSTVASES